ncbi:hypothetical protein [Streptomyces sp. C10-9-1]|uniref:hypothetical protein n=1 Tax=Streptomyces sp. C10-9-1 TaxID=1859285 RepID=UPI003F49EF9A
MTDLLTTWTAEIPRWSVPAAAAGLLLALAVTTAYTVRALRRITWPPMPVRVAAVGAFVCTVYTADTSWRFAEHSLGMTNPTERLIMFAAAELALLGCAVMARANKQATATATAAGSPGVPGVLVWVITGVQIIPAYSESGIVGGTVRAIIGPVMAGLLWHLAMGLEIRVARPEALSTGLPAVIGRELRERLLSYLGLATRDRTAEQISRDRATARVVRLASRPNLRAWGRRRLAAAVARAHVGTNGAQRHQLLQDLAARRTSAELMTVPLPSPWAPEAVPAEPYPRTPLGVTGAQLRALDPLDAVQRVQRAHPEATPAEIAALCTGYGVPVSETQVRVATHAGNRRVPDPLRDPAVPATENAPTIPGLEDVPTPLLYLDLTTAPEVHPDVRAPVPVLAAAAPRPRKVHARVSAPAVLRAGTSDDLLDRAREIDAEYRKHHGRVASIRALKTGLRIGQPLAEQLQSQLKNAGTP